MQRYINKIILLVRLVKMEKINVTSISSKGQVVIPLGIREKLRLIEGEKFVVVGEDDTILLKKMEMPSFIGIDKLLKKTQEHAKKHSLTEKDMLEAIKKTRRKK